jgi:DNA-nicking Smr family endonuclease
MTIKDKELWHSYTQGVKTTSRKPVKPHKVKTISEKSLQRKEVENIFVKPQEAKLGSQRIKVPSQTLERKREKSLRQGSIEIDAKLDMHGLTQDEAFTALAHFLHAKVKAGKRHLLIITGKGRGGEGILRQNLQGWLTQLPEAKDILALRPAAPQHGGNGAFYVLLRKR